MSFRKLYILLLIILGTATTYLYITNIKVKSNHAEYINSKELALENLVDQLLVYDVYDFDNKKVKLNRHGRAGDGGYVVPELAFEKADVLLGYGIADDISFEESFAIIYNKPSFGFDCGVKDIKSENKLCTFISECISSDKFLYSSQQSSTRVSSFSEQLKRLNLLDKKIFIKMDIEGAEYEAFKGIYKYSSQITGIAIEIHCDYMEWILKASSLLNHLSRNFYLVHVHPNNCCDHKADIFTVKNAKGKIPNVLELTFINKNLVKSAEISNNQHHPSSIDMQNCPENDSIEFELIVN